MSVVRIEKTKDYTIMSNYHFKEKEMSLKAKGLLSMMLSLPNNWNYTIAGLVAMCKENESAIKSALRELENFGYVKIIKRMPNETKSGRIEYEYIIYEKSQKQDNEKQGIENLYVENHTLLNTKQLNTNNKQTTTLNNKLFNNSSSKNASSLYTKCINLIDDFCTNNEYYNNELRDLLIQYLNLRLEMRDKPIYTNQWKGLLNKLEKISKENNQSYNDIISQSIEKGYASFYPVNKNNKSKQSNHIKWDDKYDLDESAYQQSEESF